MPQADPVRRALALGWAACIALAGATATAWAQSPAEAIAELQRTLDEPIRQDGRPAPPGLTARLKAQGIPGLSIAVIHQGRVHWAEGFGEARAGVPMSADTRLQAASISKPVAALAALRLAESLGVGLDEDLRPRLKRWQPAPDSDPTRYTLRRLLSHTAGLGTPGFPGYAVDAPRPTLPQILDGLPPANTPAVRPIQPAGLGFRYSGGGTQIVQLWVEDQTGLPFAELMQSSVLGPLGMRQSDFRQPPPDDGVPRAFSHQPRARPEPGGWRVYPEQQAAGLWTTPSDLARMLIAVQAARRGEPGPISPGVARSATTPVTWPVGLGFFLEGPDGAPRRFGHNGSNQGFESTAIAELDGGEGLVIMANSQNSGALMEAVRRTVARIYGWADERAPRAVADQRLDAARRGWVGAYEMPDRKPLRIRERQGALWLDSGPGHWHRLWLTEDGSYASVEGLRGLRLSAQGAQIDGLAGTAPRQPLPPWRAPPLFLRGTMNDWGTTQALQQVAPDRWRIDAELPAGRHELKIADAQWQQVDLGAFQDDAMPAGRWLPLTPRAGNLLLALDRPGRVRIELRLRDGPDAPRLRWQMLR